MPKKIIIIGPICIVSALFLGRWLFELDQNLDLSQFFLIILIFAIFHSAFELFVVWWDDKHKDPNASDDRYEMVGKVGIVQADCDPEGKIKIHHEIWGAVSESGAIIKAGEKIVVKERQGLKLFIEKSP